MKPWMLFLFTDAQCVAAHFAYYSNRVRVQWKLRHSRGNTEHG
jgi:hypothetical protein